MVVATTASQELRHDSGPGTLGWSELARARSAGEGDLIFDYRGVAAANRDFTNVYGRSSAQLARLEAKVAIEEPLKRTAHFELAGRVRHVSSVFVRTPAELPIAVRL